jgi:SAM-dependent methyltransferase
VRKGFGKFKGPGLLCNFCLNEFTQFAPKYPKREDVRALKEHNVIAGYGENVFCPECMSTSRDRLILAVLASMDICGKKVLHVAPEQKIFDYLKLQCSVITADLSPKFYSQVDSNIHPADLTHLPFDDRAFDMVIANHVMEHVPHDRQAMREIYRVLKPGGSAILQVPFSTTLQSTIEMPFIDNPAKQSELFGQKDHVRIYSLQDYLSRLQEAGFEVTYLSYESIADFHKYAIQPGEGFIKLFKQ